MAQAGIQAFERWPPGDWRRAKHLLSNQCVTGAERKKKQNNDKDQREEPEAKGRNHRGRSSAESSLTTEAFLTS